MVQVIFLRLRYTVALLLFGVPLMCILIDTYAVLHRRRARQSPLNQLTSL